VKGESRVLFAIPQPFCLVSTPEEQNRNKDFTFTASPCSPPILLANDKYLASHRFEPFLFLFFT
jgi:hypothetical protein